MGVALGTELGIQDAALGRTIPSATSDYDSGGVQDARCSDCAGHAMLGFTHLGSCVYKPLLF